MCAEQGISPTVLSSISDLPKLLEICVNHLNDAIVITEAEPINNPGPRIVWANLAFYERTGYSPEEIIGKSPRILQGPLTDNLLSIEFSQSTRRMITAVNEFHELIQQKGLINPFFE
jgi:PAS domain-containing protein